MLMGTDLKSNKQCQQVVLPGMKQMDDNTMYGRMNNILLKQKLNELLIEYDLFYKPIPVDETFNKTIIIIGNG